MPCALPSNVLSSGEREEVKSKIRDSKVETLWEEKSKIIYNFDWLKALFSLVVGSHFLYCDYLCRDIGCENEYIFDM